MNTQNFISPDQKKEFESLLSGCNQNFIWHYCQLVSTWFGFTYPDIFKSGKKEKEYCRLFCQHLWRYIADHEEINQHSAIVKLIDLVNEIKQDGAFKAIMAIDIDYRIAAKKLVSLN